MKSSSPVQEMFNGQSVFITGASGFIGRVLLAKLLDTYSGIKKVYILMRMKKNLSPEDRLSKQILQLPIFDRLRQKRADDGSLIVDKIQVVAGDLDKPWLGLSDEDLTKLLDDKTLSIVFHSAATIKFDEPLKVSVKLNLIATKTIIDLCRKLPNLRSFCHVSTAYVNSNILNNELIKEKLYPMREEPETLIELSRLMDEKMMQHIKSHLVDKRPNTYTYSKALAEHLISKEAADLPVVIVRPSIVVASWKEPLPGWIDNFNGPTGLLLAINKGLLRTMHVNTNAKADLIPVDVTVNTMIASAYFAAKKYHKLPFHQKETQDGISEINDDQIERPYIVHCNSGHLNPITWGQLEKQVFPIIRDNPSEQVMRYPFGTFKNNYYHDRATRIIVHILPALLLDMILYLSGRKKFLVSIYGKLHAAAAALTHFCINNYNFETRNLTLVEKELCQIDREVLHMNIKDMDWMNYWRDYVIGSRRYILKEKDETLPQARRNLQRALWFERMLRFILILLAFTFAIRILSPLTRNYLNFLWVK